MQTLRYQETSFHGYDGTPLFQQSWLPPSPSRALVLVHGIAEHSGRYAEIAQWFARRGFAVHAYDQRGHGRSLGRPGFVRAFDELLQDLDCFLSTLKSDDSKLSITLLGHSLGGLVVLAMLSERHPAVAQAVVSGPALRVSDGVSKLQMELVKVLRRIAPWLSVPNSLNLEDLSRDPEVGRRYREDSLVHQKISVSLASEILKQAPRTREAGAKIEVPVLLLHGADDRICPATASRDFFRTLQAEGSDCKIYPGLRHEIFQEPEREKVYQDILMWIENREEQR